MSNCRYIRMAGNDLGWKRPHAGRMGGEDYLGTQGLAHEDWNFAGDIWEDGRYQLYLRPTPKDFEKGLFNFVIGAHASPVPLILGFIENATYGVSKLPRNVVFRRAQEIFALNEDDSLGSNYGRLSVKEIAKRLRQEAADYQVSVAPQDLHILAQPVPIPPSIYTVSFPGYRALPMTESEYHALKDKVLSSDTQSSVDQEEEASFPEGLLVERLHKSRERSRRVVNLAKKKFIQENGYLFCEACDLNPAKRFGLDKLRNRIIEAHHDVPISDERYEGQTKPSDLRMLCPTCHRAIHTIRPWLTVEKLRRQLKHRN